MNGGTLPPAGRSGQAVLELAVGLFAILAAVVAILAAGFLSVADCDAASAARRDAVEKASGGLAASALADAGDGPAGLPGVSGAGLHHGSAGVAVELPPAAKPLFGLEPDQVAHREAWMPPTGGLQ